MSKVLVAAAILVAVLGLASPPPAMALTPYARGLWDALMPLEDPFRILEQTPLAAPKAAEALALARCDWKETTNAHIISLDVPGVRKEGIKIEVEENRVVRISGERKEEAAGEGERWHRAERSAGRFWRQFRMPASADMDNIRARLEDGVLRVTVPKLAEQKKRQPRVVGIAEDTHGAGDIQASKAEM